MKEKERVTLCEDGKYHWTYSLNLFKNLSVFFLVWKILFFIILGIFAAVMIADAVNFKDFYPERLTADLKFLAYFIIGMTAVSLTGYFLYAAIMGGRYVVDFTMDEKGVLHSQTKEQAKKARKIGAATALLGASRGNITAIGIGANAQRTEMYSEFSKVRKVKCYRRRGLIKVNGVLNRNQVYASKEDYNFVKEYIISHCENIKK
ncbi:MAG: hypothetical protein J5852_09135 [Clostridia bacterium]|nr:hypothetical protein [Clostridia bacterium]